MRQQEMTQEMNSMYPQIKNDIDQSLFRLNYLDRRRAGATHEAARDESITLVRKDVPGFAPIEHPQATERAS